MYKLYPHHVGRRHIFFLFWWIYIMEYNLSKLYFFGEGPFYVILIFIKLGLLLILRCDQALENSKEIIFYM